MKDLLYKYKTEGAVKSKLANFVWKTGIVISSLFYCIDILFFKKENYYMIGYFFTIIILFVFSGIIFIINASKKINFKINYKKILNINYLKCLFDKIDEYQKKWITDYCNKRKINNINKLNIIMQEIKSEKEKTTIRYINPIIIGTLALTIWEFAVKEIVNITGFWGMLPIALALIIIISIFLGWFRKTFLEDKEIFDFFEIFSSKDRLEELILYRILKSRK